MLWKCSWWRQACKRCCLRSCWGSRVVHKLKIHALWKLHQISLSLCFLEVKKKGILKVQIHKETTSKCPLSRGLVICFCCFHFLNRDTSTTCLIILRGILLRHHTFTFYRSLVLILPCFPSSIYICCLKSFNTTVTAPAQNRNTSTRTSGHCNCTCRQFTPSLLSKLP